MSTGKAPYGRSARSATPTYYDLPAVKQSHWKWLITTYFFVGGIAGAAQAIAAMADLVGGRRGRPLVRWGRYLALAGALISPGLLIKDLHTPSRWYNMLRIFRPTSPMNIGAWTLAAFGTLSGLAALVQLVEDLTHTRLGWWAARLLGTPAAFSGMLMSVYTGTLLAATSTPLWAVLYRHLPALFGASATASATAALTLVLQGTRAPRDTLRRLERLALVASGTQLALALAAEQRLKRLGVSGPIEQPPISTVYRVGVLGFGMAGPLVVHTWQVLTGSRSRSLSTLAAMATLVGGFVERAVLVFAGRQSALRPDDYFRLAQPEMLDTLTGGER